MVIRSRPGTERGCVTRYPPGRRVALSVLGEGRVEARVAERLPLDWHGIRNLAWRVRLRLDDGREVAAMDLGGRLTIPDPRFRELPVT